MNSEGRKTAMWVVALLVFAVLAKLGGVRG